MADLLTGDLLSIDADLIALPVVDDGPAVWRDALGKPFDRALADAQATKKPAVIHPADGPRLAVVAVGEEPGDERWRWAAAAVASAAGGLELGRVVLAVPPGEGAATAAALVEGFLLGSYRYAEYKSDPGPEAPALAVWTEAEPDGLAEAVETAEVRAEATAFARDLVNLSLIHI